MIKYLKDLYKDWETFRMIRKNLSVLDPIKNEDLIRYIVNRYSEENEKNISDLLLASLTKELVKDNVTPEKYRWYLMCLEHRNMLFQNNRKLLNKKPQ